MKGPFITVHHRSARPGQRAGGFASTAMRPGFGARPTGCRALRACPGPELCALCSTRCRRLGPGVGGRFARSAVAGLRARPGVARLGRVSDVAGGSRLGSAGASRLLQCGRASGRLSTLPEFASGVAGGFAPAPVRPGIWPLVDVAGVRVWRRRALRACPDTARALARCCRSSHLPACGGRLARASSPPADHQEALGGPSQTPSIRPQGGLRPPTSSLPATTDIPAPPNPRLWTTPTPVDNPPEARARCRWSPVRWIPGAGGRPHAGGKSRPQGRWAGGFGVRRWVPS